MELGDQANTIGEYQSLDISISAGNWALRKITKTHNQRAPRRGLPARSTHCTIPLIPVRLEYLDISWYVHAIFDH